MPSIGTLTEVLEEGEEHVGEAYKTEELRDSVIIGSATRVEHYEIAAYMGAIEYARILGLSEVQELLEETLAEEEAADEKLRVGQAVNPSAASGNQEDNGGGGIVQMLARTFSGGDGPARGKRPQSRGAANSGRGRKAAK